jgi:hypothetical protein
MYSVTVPGFKTYASYFAQAFADHLTLNVTILHTF